MTSDYIMAAERRQQDTPISQPEVITPRDSETQVQHNDTGHPTLIQWEARHPYFGAIFLILFKYSFYLKFCPNRYGKSLQKEEPLWYI
jgi:hypothetical protein